MRCRLLVSAVTFATCVAATSGCAQRGARARMPSAATSEAALTIRLDDRMGDGVRIERLLVVLDGAVIYHRVADAYFVLPRVLAAIQLPAGDHTMQMLVTASAPCGLLDQPRWRMELRSARSFFVGERAIDLRIVLATRGATAAPTDLMRLHIVETLGLRLSPNATPAPEIPIEAPMSPVHMSASTGCPPPEAIAGSREDD